MKQRCRHRQQRPTNKTWYLQKLLPWDGKVDMATVLEEVYKYINFLQAQVSVLQSMPCESNSSSAAVTNIDGSGNLGKLNRQKLLQVVVNSRVAFTQWNS
ncbi:transcription factor bhlh117 [Phtheirospermum japonicum]|uniref:Transcription factor bhlh117 n=1 Tax=Phtheirospermum japonicum TaxID=374723 RepID=A0A830BJT1_9LAMI|nr:transcription factor bhlh117 [Phtheirospermum japonicum]